MKYIKENLNNINSIKQTGFSIVDQLNIANKISVKNNIDTSLISTLLEKINVTNNTSISRVRLLEILKTGAFEIKHEILLILSWGIFFKVMNSTNQTNIISLLNFLNIKSNEELFEYVNQIKNTDFEIEYLFKKFGYNGEYKIPGLDYAYFTKLFFFYSENNKLPILDQWTTKAYIYLILNDDLVKNKNSITESIWKANPFNENNKAFRIKRKKNEFYSNYVKYLHNLSDEYGLNVCNLEAFIFGWDKKKNLEVNFINPRFVYEEYFKNYFDCDIININKI